MPKLDLILVEKINKVLMSVKALELANLPHYSELEEIYEKKFLTIFSAWEDFLEKAFLNYICGRQSANCGCCIMNGGVKYYKSLKVAESAMLTRPTKGKGKKKDEYFLWANPKKVVQMVKRHVVNGRHEFIAKNWPNDLSYYSRIRNRIAHEQQRDARAKFKDAVLKLSGLRVTIGYRPGRFLRKWNGSVRWLEFIATRLIAIAKFVI